MLFQAIVEPFQPIHCVAQRYKVYGNNGFYFKIFIHNKTINYHIYINNNRQFKNYKNQF